ncbi:MAG: flagellar biosynthetic protein FliR [Eubacteriales bacterium]
MPDITVISTFFLVFLRAVAFMMSGPLYAIKGLPPLVKVGFSLALAVVVFPVLDFKAPLPEGAWAYGLAVISETGVGVLLGTAVTMILNSIKMAGQFIDFQIGYSMATLIDPHGTQNTLLSEYLYLLTLIFFLLMDGHYTLIAGLFKSYQIIPLSAAAFGGGMAQILLKIFCGAFTIALQVSVPVLAVLMITDLSLGFLSRTVPQINVFITGFPVKIIVGLLTLSFFIPFFGTILRALIDMIEKDLYAMMKVLV